MILVVHQRLRWDDSSITMFPQHMHAVYVPASVTTVFRTVGASVAIRGTSLRGEQIVKDE
jgi:hypothetical protein